VVRDSGLVLAVVVVVATLVLICVLFVCLLQPSVFLKLVFVGVVTVVFVVAPCLCMCPSLSFFLLSELEELGVCGLFVFQGIEEWQLCPE